MPYASPAVSYAASAGQGGAAAAAEVISHYCARPQTITKKEIKNPTDTTNIDWKPASFQIRFSETSLVERFLEFVLPFAL